MKALAIILLLGMASYIYLQRQTISKLTASEAESQKRNEQLTTQLERASADLQARVPNQQAVPPAGALNRTGQPAAIAAPSATWMWSPGTLDPNSSSSPAAPHKKH
jgi:hypothetical protein